MSYCYGQAIYATVRFRFFLPSLGRLNLTYQDSPPQQAFRGFAPTLETHPRDFGFSLTKEDYSGVEANAGPFTYHWNLTLSAFPFPEQLGLPPVAPDQELRLPAPLTYYGYGGSSG